MNTEVSFEIRSLMSRFRSGDRSAADALVDHFYPELRRIAAARMQTERLEHTWTPTVLVNELYLELVKNRASTTMIFDPTAKEIAPATSTPAFPTEDSVVSPDGNWVAFESAESGPKQIWLRDTMSGRVQLVAGGNCNNSSPAWEEDSHTLIFASDCGRGIGMPVLYRANLPLQTHTNVGFGIFTAADWSTVTTVAQKGH